MAKYPRRVSQLPHLTRVQKLRLFLNRRLRVVARFLYYRHAGAQERPVYFDVARICPELVRIDENWDVISEELGEVLKGRTAIPRYHEVDPLQKDISAEEGNAWRTFIVYRLAEGGRSEGSKQCPRTAEILESLPGCLQAFFSILEPGHSIPAHNGPNLHYLRYHTAFVVPTDAPPTIRIRDTYYTWKERESVLFDDSYNHEIYNRSQELRVVLIVDVLRPAPWPAATLMRFVLWNLGSVMRRARGRAAASA